MIANVPLVPECMVTRYSLKQNRYGVFPGYLGKLQLEYIEMKLFYVAAIILLLPEMYG